MTTQTLAFAALAFEILRDPHHRAALQRLAGYALTHWQRDTRHPRARTAAMKDKARPTTPPGGSNDLLGLLGRGGSAVAKSGSHRP